MKRTLLILIVFLIAACGNKTTLKPQSTVGKAALVNPLRDQTCTNGTVISVNESAIDFSWSSAENATSYEVTVKNLLTQKIVTKTSNSTDATITLQRNTPYSWFVTAKSAKFPAGTASDTWKFYNAGAGVISYAPFPAELLTPTFGQVFTSSTQKVNLTWKGSAVDNNIVAYAVYFGPKSNPDIFRERITDAFVNDVAVSTNTTYYWRVVTIDANGNISDSGMNNFYVK